MIIYEAVAQQILDRSIAIVDGILPVHILNDLREEALLDFGSGEFHEARIGKGIEKQRVSEIRSDKVRWLQRSEASDAQLAYWEFMDGLRVSLANFFRIHLERTELHFAVYPRGAFYAPHVDKFRDHSNRVFSVIIYLNPDWKVGDGGELRIHHTDGTKEDIAPLHGRLVCFRSDEVLHEVLVANELRVSVTGWVRRDPLLY